MYGVTVDIYITTATELHRTYAQNKHDNEVLSNKEVLLFNHI